MARYVWRKRKGRKTCVNSKTGKRVKSSNCKKGKRSRKGSRKRRSLRSLGLGMGLMDFGRAPRRRRRMRRR